MRRYLDAYRQILPPFERQALESYLNSFGPDVSGSEEDQKARIEALLAAMDQDRRVFVSPRLMQGQLSSRDFNANWQEILTDLHALYRRTKNIEAILANHQAIARSAIARLDREIKALASRIEALAVANDRFGGFHAAWSERFEVPRIERSLNPAWYFDPLGLMPRSNFVARIDPIGQALTLAVHQEISATQDPSGLVTGFLEIAEMSGEAFRDPDPRFGPQNALDGDPDSVWAEVILSDGVFHVPYTVGAQTIVDHGAWVLLKLAFASAIPVNGLYLLPYGEYPMDLVRVTYQTGEEPHGNQVLFEGSLPLPSGTFVTLPSVSAKALYILLRQRHAVRHVYTITEDALRRRSFWQAAAGLHKEISRLEWWVAQDERARSAVLQSRLESLDIAWQAYLQAAATYAESLLQGQSPVQGASTVVAGVLPERPKRIAVERYEYLLGLRELAAKYTEHEPASCYVSPPLALPANAIEVMLEVDEEHPFLSRWGYRKARNTVDPGALPIDGLPERRTSVEYWVAPGENPSEERWYPILPAGETAILDERIAFSHTPDAEGYHIAPLRFAADPTKEVRVYRNHDPLDPTVWDLAPDRTGQPRILRLSQAHFDPAVVYTADYTPDASRTPHVVSFLSVLRKPDGGLWTTAHTQHFPGADRHFSVALEHPPWVDRERLKTDSSYNPVRVTLNRPDAPGRNPDLHRIQIGETATPDPIVSTRDPNWTPPPDQPRARLLNVTRYRDEDLPVLDPYDPMAERPTFQYFHVGNKVYFSEDFRSDGPEANYGVSHGNAIVTVEYETFVTHVRVKAILRNNDPSDPGLSPRVRRLLLKVRTT